MRIFDKAVSAEEAAIHLGASTEEQRNNSLAVIRNSLLARSAEIFEANKKDLENAVRNDVPTPLIKRLKFDEQKLSEVCSGIDALVRIPDPLGRIISARELDEGLELYQVTCPIGVIGVIFESRPDALVQISTLCLKSGNAVILKGGSEAMETNRILAEVIASSTDGEGLPKGWIQLAESRSEVRDMLNLESEIDLIIPRGSNEFVKYIMDNTNIPVLGHADGVCHVYVHSDANVEQAVRVVVDSKTQYVAVCNALETLLVNRDIASSFLPAVVSDLRDKNVVIKGCDATRAFVDVDIAEESDWSTEYLDLVLSIRIVESLEDAIGHINTYGSHHTDTILTSERETAEHFMNLVDSANVLWNCSTRFSDGYRYGLGAEVGIGTGKIHARGPVGMEGLLIYKWKLYGNGHIVNDYGPTGRGFTHKPINGK